MTEKTGCVCDNPGFCTRHQIKKSPHYHSLCRNHQGYFNMWETCQGPGQRFVDCNHTIEEVTEGVVNTVPAEKFGEAPPTPTPAPPPPPLKKEPGLLTKARNFSGAMIDWAKDGFTMSAEEVKKARLDICAECPLLNKQTMRCHACGCPVNSKAGIKSQKCPQGRWPV